MITLYYSANTFLLFFTIIKKTKTKWCIRCSWLTTRSLLYCDRVVKTYIYRKIIAGSWCLIGNSKLTVGVNVGVNNFHNQTSSDT